MYQYQKDVLTHNLCDFRAILLMNIVLTLSKFAKKFVCFDISNLLIAIQCILFKANLEKPDIQISFLLARHTKALKVGTK